MSNTNTQQLEVVKKDISTQVLQKVEAFKNAGELRIPEDYSPENALKSAYLILSETKNREGKFALDHCTKESIANALLKMVVWGLSPLKKQCDFIMYGNKLECSIEYTGNIALAKRYGGLKDIKPITIFEGDDFEFEIDAVTGRKKILKHKQTLESLGSKNVKGAYAIMTFLDDTTDVEIMSINQIKDAWNQGAANGNSPAHKNFPDQMANKTVINRATKLLIRASDDSVLFNKEEEEVQPSIVKAEVEHEITMNANAEEIAFEELPNENTEPVQENYNQQHYEEQIQSNDGPGF
ncbi:recombinase RecT [Myroides odoratimimus]|uniref:RecT family recombinase n=1 Tax=Myroides odoratimimus TaxID=76832 RepID=UPI002576D9D6|nr:RecT family recombinase [Myroides odoratimimus]MDM1396091.1 recombinase RecT [Myroides odoratimimus]